MTPPSKTPDTPDGQSIDAVWEKFAEHSGWDAMQAPGWKEVVEAEQAAARALALAAHKLNCQACVAADAIKAIECPTAEYIAALGHEGEGT